MTIAEFIAKHGGSAPARRALVKKGIVIPWGTWKCWMNPGPNHREPPGYVVDAMERALIYGRKRRKAA